MVVIRVSLALSSGWSEGIALVFLVALDDVPAAGRRRAVLLALEVPVDGVVVDDDAAGVLEGLEAAAERRSRAPTATAVWFESNWMSPLMCAVADGSARPPCLSWTLPPTVEPRRT